MELLCSFYNRGKQRGLRLLLRTRLLGIFTIYAELGARVRRVTCECAPSCVHVCAELHPRVRQFTCVRAPIGVRACAKLQAPSYMRACAS